MEIKQMPKHELSRLAEIDRAEVIPQAYVVRDGQLVLEDVNWVTNNWPLQGEEFSVQRLVDLFAPMLEAGSVLLGAFDGETLAGIGVLRCRLTETMAQLALLHVSRGYRGQGAGTALTQEMFRLARLDGATHIYVSSIPTKNSVDFYRSQGFELTTRPHPGLFALEPEDIHMVCEL
jgi:predicted N-acetyltransferase YhbS